jgi:hypothetical protein
MPVLEGRTREQVRQSVGYNLAGSRFVVSTTSRLASTVNNLNDRNRLYGGDDAYNGWWAWITDGAQEGLFRRVNDFVQGTAGTDADTSHQAIVQPGWAAALASGVGYELWPPEFPPYSINEYINQAIGEAYGRAYDPVEITSLHAANSATRFAIPSGISAISEIYYRESITHDEIHACDRIFDETVPTGVTALADTNDHRRGGTSLRLTVTAAAAANALITDSITSLDIRDMTHVEMWAKSSIATVAADVHLLLDDTANAASPLETLAFPALTAGVWTHFEVALSTPQLDTALISVGVRFTTDNGAGVLWVDDIRGVRRETAVWRLLSRRGWSIDQEAGLLILTEGAMRDVGYARLKLVGGDAPVLLSADATVSEISANWLIARATELAFRAVPGRPQYEREASTWAIKAELARRGLMRLRGARKVA